MAKVGFMLLSLQGAVNRIDNCFDGSPPEKSRRGATRIGRTSSAVTRLPPPRDFCVTIPSEV